MEFARQKKQIFHVWEAEKAAFSPFSSKLFKIVKMHKSLTWDYIALRFKL